MIAYVESSPTTTTQPSHDVFQERLKQERWEAEQNRANQPEPEPEPEAEPEPPKPARQMSPEPAPDSESSYEPTDDTYQIADDPYSESQVVSEEPAAPASQPAQQQQPEPSPYEFEEDDNVYNQVDDEAPARSQGSVTAVALYDYQAGEVLFVC